MLSPETTNNHSESEEIRMHTQSISGIRVDAVENAQWKTCKNLLRERLPAPFYKSFIEPIKSGECTDDSITLHCEERIIPHINSRYMNDIITAFADTAFHGQVSLRSFQKKINSSQSEKPQNSENNFRDFLPNPANEAEFKLIQELNFPETILFLTGPTGSGKSTFAKIIIKAAEKNGLKGLRFSLEEFITEFAESLKTKSTENWKTSLRECSLLIIDDFQFIKKGALRTQEELRSLIDSLHKSDGKLIICSDKSPEAHPLQPDILSRIQSGRMVQVLLPEKRQREEILNAECRRLNVVLSSVEISRIAASIPDDIRKLKSAVSRLKYRRYATDIHAHIGDLFTAASIKPHQVLKEVASHFQLDVDAVTGPARDRKFVIPRQITAYLCQELLGMKLTDIAALLGRKDHSGIVHSRKRVEKLMETDLFYTEEIRKIRQKIQNESC